MNPGNIHAGQWNRAEAVFSVAGGGLYRLIERNGNAEDERNEEKDEKCTAVWRSGLSVLRRR